MADYRREFPHHVDAVTELELLPFDEELAGPQRQAAALLLGAVALVHLIACFNVANLLLARFTARARENALRLSLGAAPARLVADFLGEALALSAVAALLGAALAALLLQIFRPAFDAFLPRGPVQLDLAALGFMVVLTLLTALAVGWVPARLALRRDLLETLKESGRLAGGTGRGNGFRRALLVGEIAFSLVLLIAVGLVATSFVRLLRIDPGFRPRGVFVAEIELPRARYDTPARQLAAAQEIVARLSALPGVAPVALSDSPPLQGSPTLSPYAAADRPLPPINQRTIALRRVVSPGQFAALGVPLLEGRDFSAQDGPDTPVVAIVNSAAARALFPDGAPALGREIVLGITTRTAKVIGIAGDARSESLTSAPKPEVYFAFAQRPRAAFSLLLRSEDPPAALTPSVRALLREFDPEIPLINPRGLESDFRQFLAAPVLAVRLLALFSGVALALALGGIYSVMRYTVLQRRTEIGIRLLLGASPAQVRGLLVREGAVLTAIGLTVGLVGTLFVSALFRRVLYGVPPVHLPTYAAACLLLGAVAVLTCWLAARRASAIDPVEVLHAE